MRDDSVLLRPDDVFSGGEFLCLVNLASAAETGRSKVEMPVEFSGKAIEIGFDPKFIGDMLKMLEPDAPITMQLTDEKVPAVFTQDPNYTYVVVPLVGAAGK